MKRDDVLKIAEDAMKEVMAKRGKHNCWECKHRGSVAGSAHIRCTVLPSPVDFVVAMKRTTHPLKGGAVMKIGEESVELDLVELDAHGIENGWCDWPLQFDPVWVKKCLLFKKNEGNDGKQT